MLEELVQSLQSGRWDHAYRDAFVALVESRAFMEIVEQLGAHLTDGDLRELISGHPDPSSDSAGARARNKEFEWFTAALFRRGGLHVALAEPDILIKVKGEVRSVAAKRVWSRRKFDANISRASAQIAREGYPGYVVLDLTKYVDPSTEYIEHWRDEGGEVMRRLRAVAKSPSVRVRRNSLVQGVFLRAAYPQISPEFEYGTAEHWVAATVEGGDEQEHRLLCHMLTSGMRGT